MTIPMKFFGVISLLLGLALSGIGVVTAEEAVSAAEVEPSAYARWQAQAAKLRQDPTLVRYYFFEEKKGFTVANSAGDGQGELTLVSNAPYGQSRERRWWVWNSPFYQTFSEWTTGRWPEKGALASGLAGECVVRSRFSGTDDGIFSLAAWVRVHGGADANGSSSLFNISDGYQTGWRITYQRAPWVPAGRLEYRFGTPKGPVIAAATPFAAQVWHHLVCLWDGKALRLFVDGAPVAEQPCAGPYTGIARNEAWSQSLPEMDTGGFHFGGKPGNERFDVDEVAIFSRTLTADEVRAQFEAGRPAMSPAAQKTQFGQQLARNKALAAIVMNIPNDTLGIFRRGAKIPARIAIPATIGWQGEFHGHFLLRDLRNQVILEETLKLSAMPGGDAEAVLEIAPERCGIYFLDLWLTDAAGAVVKRLREEYGLAVTVPLPDAKDIPLTSPLMAHNISGGYQENRFLGFGVDRWIKGSEAYKKLGEIDPSVFGSEMDFERKSGLKVMFCLHMGMPAWAERVPGKKFLLKDMNIWADYCRQMFRQYKDMVAFWELENEPNAGDLIPADEYVEFLKIGYRTIKAEDPNAVVLGLCGCPGFLNWNDKVFAAGGAKDFDVLALHNYTTYPVRSCAQERLVERAIEQLVKARSERVPVWNTETGFHPAARIDGRPVTEDVLARLYPRIQQQPGQPSVVPADAPTLTEHANACWQVQSILLDLGAGCAKYFMLAGGSHYNPPVNSSDGQPSEVAPAVAAVASVLIPSQSVTRLPLSSSADAGVLITHADGRRIAALFSDETPTLSFRVDRPGTFSGMDLVGNPLAWEAGADKILTVRLGAEPVYVFDVPAEFAQLQFLTIANAPAKLPESGLLDGELTVTNPLAKPLVATLQPEAPKGATLTVETRIDLAPGQSRTLPFHLDGRELKRRRYEIGFQLLAGAAPLGKLNYGFQSDGTIRHLPELAGTAKLGDGVWWKSAPAELCADVDNVVHGQPIVGVPWAPQWKGPKDLSCELRMGWLNDEALLIRLDVTDDVLLPASAEQRGMCFRYDCIELFFDGRSLADRKDVYSPGAEQMLVIPNAGITAAPCDFWFAGKKPTVRAEFTGARTATGYWIEGIIRPEPGASLRIKAGTQFAFDVLVDDTDSETALRKDAMALHGIFNNSSDPSKWGRYQLAPAAPETRADTKK